MGRSWVGGLSTDCGVAMASYLRRMGLAMVLLPSNCHVGRTVQSHWKGRSAIGFEERLWSLAAWALSGTLRYVGALQLRRLVVRGHFAAWALCSVGNVW